MELRAGGDALNWFFLGMSHRRLGERDEARTRYDQAVAWMEKHQPKNEELLRTRAEAEELLRMNEQPRGLRRLVSGDVAGGVLTATQASRRAG